MHSTKKKKKKLSHFRSSASRANKLLLFHASFVCTAIQHTLYAHKACGNACKQMNLIHVLRSEEKQKKPKRCSVRFFLKNLFKSLASFYWQNTIRVPLTYQLTSNEDITALYEPGIILLKNLLKNCEPISSRNIAATVTSFPERANSQRVIPTLVLLSHNEDSENL